MLIMDSGLGGLSVVRALRAIAPGQGLCYVGDVAAFPYGNRSAEEITQRAIAVISQLAQQVDFSTVVLACNTLSTLSLAELRKALPQRFVGTVPAIKVAAKEAQRFTLLATPNTAHSDYSKRLIAEFAADCVVDCYGAANLAAMAEAQLLAGAFDEAAQRAELAPAFFDDAHGKTEAVILGCTHYPLLQSQLEACAPWPVRWIDSSQAIARQALLQNGATPPNCVDVAYITSPAKRDAYTVAFARDGFKETRVI